MNISVIQFDIEFNNPSMNREKVINKIKNIKLNTDIIVLPEMWNTSFNFETINEDADDNGHPTITMLSDIAKQNSVNIVAGSIADKEGNKIYNRAYVINRDGNTIHTYEKVHLVHHTPENKYITAGNNISCFEIDGIKCAVILCYDLRFPEIARKLALEGAKIIFVVAQWFESRIHHWNILNKARALENQLYIVAANRIGKEYKAVFPGQSMIIDPWGNEVDKLDNKEGILSVDIDLELINRVRQKVTCFNDIRNDLYY